MEAKVTDKLQFTIYHLLDVVGDPSNLVLDRLNPLNILF